MYITCTLHLPYIYITVTLTLEPTLTVTVCLRLIFIDEKGDDLIKIKLKLFSRVIKPLPLLPMHSGGERRRSRGASPFTTPASPPSRSAWGRGGEAKGMGVMIRYSLTYLNVTCLDNFL